MIIIQNEGNDDDDDDYAYISKIILCDYLHMLLQQIVDKNEYDYLRVYVIFFPLKFSHVFMQLNP